MAETEKSVLERLKDIITEQMPVDADSVVPEADFVDDLGADSLDYVELLERTEEEFGIEIPDEESDKFKTVGDAVKYVQQETGLA